MNTSVEPVIPRPLPDGMNLSDYKNYEKASAAVWAWVFLRRNPTFQRRCRALPNEQSTKRSTMEKRIARDFGLREFKHWQESYNQKGTKRPVFDSLAIWSRINDGESTRRLTIPMRKSEVVMRFDLLPATTDRKAIAVQLWRAYEFLTKRIDELTSVSPELRTTTEPEKKNKSLRARGGHDQRVTWLRIYDAKNAGHDTLTAYRQVFPRRNTPDREARKFVDDALETAESYIMRRYLTYAFEDAPRIRFEKSKKG